MEKLALPVLTLVFLVTLAHYAEAKIDPALEQIINDNINYVSTTVIGDLEAATIIDNIYILFGEPTINLNGVVDKTGFYGNFLHAYHFGYPASPREWVWAYLYALLFLERYENFIRARQMDWIQLDNFKKVCEDAINSAKLDADDNNPPTLNSEKVNEALENCADQSLLKWVKDDYPDFKKQLKAAWALSVDMVGRAIYLSYHGYHALTVDYSLPFPDKAKNYWEVEEVTVPLTLFGRMLAETKESRTLIPEYISKLTALIQEHRRKGDTNRANHLQSKLDEINRKLQAHPYDKLYSNGDPNLVAQWEATLSVFSTYLEFDQNFSPYLLLFFSHLIPTQHDDLTSWTGKYHYDTLLEGENPYYKDDSFFDELELYFDYLVNMYNTFLYVDPNTPTQADPDLDGEWQWQIDKKGLHSLRLAWDLLDKIVEELKCYLGKTYYFDLRNEALQKTQQNLTHLYSFVSPTLFKPCLNNDADLIGECTKENHEICRPMHFNFEVGQNPEHETHGGRSLLKPKWYFEKKRGKDECEGMKSFIAPYKSCQCGFRLDCGTDLGSQRIICQLKSDYLRKQCRGTVGYPCKTMPLAPGRHHESCITGYCDMEENSCEDFPIHEYGKDGGSRVILGWVTVWIVLVSKYF